MVYSKTIKKKKITHTHNVVIQEPVSRDGAGKHQLLTLHYGVHAACLLSKQQIGQLRAWEWLNLTANYYLRRTPRQAAAKHSNGTVRRPAPVIVWSIPAWWHSSREELNHTPGHSGCDDSANTPSHSLVPKQSLSTVSDQSLPRKLFSQQHKDLCTSVEIST